MDALFPNRHNKPPIVYVGPVAYQEMMRKAELYDLYSRGMCQIHNPPELICCSEEGCKSQWLCNFQDVSVYHDCTEMRCCDGGDCFDDMFNKYYCSKHIPSIFMKIEKDGGTLFLCDICSEKLLDRDE